MGITVRSFDAEPEMGLICGLLHKTVSSIKVINGKGVVSYTLFKDKRKKGDKARIRWFVFFIVWILHKYTRVSLAVLRSR